MAQAFQADHLGLRTITCLCTAYSLEILKATRVERYLRVARRGTAQFYPAFLLFVCAFVAALCHSITTPMTVIRLVRLCRRRRRRRTHSSNEENVRNTPAIGCLP